MIIPGLCTKVRHLCHGQAAPPPKLYWNHWSHRSWAHPKGPTKGLKESTNRERTSRGLFYL